MPYQLKQRDIEKWPRYKIYEASPFPLQSETFMRRRLCCLLYDIVMYEKNELSTNSDYKSKTRKRRVIVLHVDLSTVKDFYYIVKHNQMTSIMLILPIRSKDQILNTFGGKRDFVSQNELFYQYIFYQKITKYCKYGYM